MNSNFQDDKEKTKSGGCCEDGCGCSDDSGSGEACDCGHDHGHEHGHDHGQEHATIVMTDTETGKEYTFQVEDMFEYEGDMFYVLVTTDEADPELVITKVVEMEDGTEGLVSLDAEESERVYAEYDRLCDEAESEEEADDDEDGTDAEA